jgi:hypothetical protein
MRSVQVVRWSCVSLVLAMFPLAASAGTQVTAEGSNLTPVFEAGDGWKTVANGVWQRPAPGGVETYATGVQGLRFALDQLQKQLVPLVDGFLASPSDKRKEILDNHLALVREVEADLAAKEKAGVENSGAVSFDSTNAAAAAACTRSFSYGANINSFHCLKQANANAAYSTSNPTACPELCTVHSYAYAQSSCSDPMEVSDSCTLTGTSVSCSSYAYVYAAGTCYFYGFGSVHCPALGGLYLYQTTSDPTCLSWCGSC